jgi:endonuclease/exonuclease/phosphatase (EEP) superfamily protein YafD
MVLGLATTCLIAALAAAAGPLHPALDLVREASPVWLAGSALAVSLGLAVRKQPGGLLAAGLAAVGVLAGCALVAPEYLRPIPVMSAPPIGATSLSLIQLNAWVQNRDPEGTAAWLAARSPDVITLEDARPPIRAALIRRGYHVTRGISDTAIFSKAWPIRSGVIVPAALWPGLPGFARATFMTPNGPFTVVAVHLKRPYLQDTRPAIAALGTLLDGYDRSRVIVAGDFNLAPWSSALGMADVRLGLLRRDRALASWPARPWPWPLLPIDHVYAGSRLASDRPVRAPAPGSSHYALITTLVLH